MHSKIIQVKAKRDVFTGADPENIEPGGACINHQAEPGGANLFFCLTYKGEQGGVRRVIYMVKPASKGLRLFNVEMVGK